MDGTPCEPGKRDICVDGVCRVSYAPTWPPNWLGIVMPGVFRPQQDQVAVKSLVASSATSTQNAMRSLQMFPDHRNFAPENTNLMRESLDG